MVSVQEQKEDEEVEKNEMPLEEAQEINSVGESLFEEKLDTLEEEYRQEQHYKEKVFIQENEEKNVKIDYQEIQMQIILTDIERKTIWEEYKLYVDELVLNGLQNATLCR